MSPLEEKLDFKILEEAKQVDEAAMPRMDEATYRRWMDSAMAQNPDGIMSTTLDDGAGPDAITLDKLATIGTDAQQSIDKVLSANKIIRRAINTNDLIGLVVDVIASCVNTDIKLSFPNLPGGKKVTNKLEKAKQLLNRFNEQIDVKQFIRDRIVDTYISGTTIDVLRNQGDEWSVTKFPLGIAELSGYSERNRPIVTININKLKSAMTHTILKNRKGKALYFQDVEDEIENVFGPEIREAYHNKETYCRMPTRYTGVSRINNAGGRYGFSPVFKALPSMILLDAQRNADLASAVANRKLIIHQKMRKELCNINVESSYEQMNYAHENLARAMRQSTVLVTTPPGIEEVSYIQPKSSETTAIQEREELYSRQILASLGISFIVPSSSMSATTVKISYEILQRNINRIGESIERVLRDFYRTVLEDNGFGEEFLPEVRIIDSEMLSNEEKIEYAKLLLTTFATSRETAFETLGLNIHDETAKRVSENSAGLNDIYTPYPLSYTTSGNTDNEGGRPSGGDDNGRQDYDETYNESR